MVERVECPEQAEASSSVQLWGKSNVRLAPMPRACPFPLVQASDILLNDASKMMSRQEWWGRPELAQRLQVFQRATTRAALKAAAHAPNDEDQVRCSGNPGFGAVRFDPCRHGLQHRSDWNPRLLLVCSVQAAALETLALVLFDRVQHTVPMHKERTFGTPGAHQRNARGGRSTGQVLGPAWASASAKRGRGDAEECEGREGGVDKGGNGMEREVGGRREGGGEIGKAEDEEEGARGWGLGDGAGRQELNMLAAFHLFRAAHRLQPRYHSMLRSFPLL